MNAIIHIPHTTRILLVEDYEINRLCTAAMLERCGYIPETAHNGARAVEMVLAARIEQPPFHLVLMDVQMPECDGYAATHRLRAAGINGEELPIIALTATAYAADVSAAFKAGMQDHLAKPLVFKEFVDVLKRYLPSALQEERQPHTASLAILSHTPQNPPQVPARISAADRLTAQWQKRQREALGAVSDAVHKDRFDGTAAVDLARILHNIAGTAGKFGACELGIRAGALERALKNGEANLIGELAESFLRAP